ncbi:hypothetical protein K443DRAFT_102903, partial [Laccaria amethystina LaAM-08-1]
PIRSNLAFGFMEKGCPLPEYHVQLNNLTSFRNMIPNRSKPAFGSVESRVYYKKLRPTGEFLLDFYPLGLYLTEIASGITS